MTEPPFARPRAPGAVRRRAWWRQPLLRVATRLAPATLSALLRVLSWTLRWTLVNREELSGRWARGERVIVAFWHNRLLLMPVVAAGHRVCILNSEHRDGEIATRVAARWGICAVRGSATRGGVKGFLQLVKAYREGCDLAMVPDGPRGPRYTVKPGVIQLAKMTGAVIVPVSYAASRAKRLRSWDRLVIPMPFSRVVFVVGEPLAVPRTADAAQIECLRRDLEQRLNDSSRVAEAGLLA